MLSSDLIAHVKDGGVVAYPTSTLPGLACLPTKASLDALCRRFGVDNSARENHGALLDSKLLAEVYLELKGGRQSALALDAPVPGQAPASEATAVYQIPGHTRERPRPLAPRITAEERSAHRRFIAELGEKALAAWKRIENRS